MVVANMWCKTFLLLIGVTLQTCLGQSIWLCQSNFDCASIGSGMVCQSGTCICPLGTENLDGSSCKPMALYYASPCHATSQCQALMNNFECRKSDDNDVGQCLCQEGYHYFLGRCWETAGFGEQCTRDEECIGTLKDPYNLACSDGVCACANGYYLRQRGECRESSFNVGDDCMVNEDCQFQNGVCDLTTFKCVDQTAAPDTSYSQQAPMKQAETKAEIWDNSTSLSMTSAARTHFATCKSSQDCSNNFVCTAFGYCACPRGYYVNAANTECLAELGSPSADNQCLGFLAETRDGICRCPKNFYYDDNMRDCVKATRRLTDACATDNMCHTFGASARCGEPGTFQMRTCDCTPGEAVMDANMQLCRLLAGIGDYCEVNSDCLVGNMEILCVHDTESGDGSESVGGVCSCPEGYSNVGGLCLTTGLSLGDTCQANTECTENEHAECINGYCSCSEGYTDIEGTCAAVIGGGCQEDNDCVTENSVCDLTNNSCRCAENFIEHDSVCYPQLPDDNAYCTITAQCIITTGEASACVEGQCVCFEGYHLSDGRCWRKAGLFETCSRSSECFLEDITDRVQCRNSLCQCSFDYPYSEELRTCTSSATASVGSLFMTILALIYVKINY